MPVEPNHHLESIFAKAIELLDPDERRLLLDRACGQDPELHREVKRLVDNHFKAGQFLNRVGKELPDTFLERPVAAIGYCIGRYKLMEQIGEGGMGVVYVAEQVEPVRRRVALKIIKPGMDSKQVVARFEAERQALALMNHPNIAKVLDAGTTESGTPFFVMELVKGVPITEFCDKRKLDLHARLELFVKVCEAVQHAHQKGIIHRDLKPSNILVELEDVRAVPKVIDFGVAKAIQQPLTEHTLYTGIGQMIGTPLYMSPEQAEFNSLDIDTRSDVYTLGVILYELITGSTPFDRNTLKHVGFDEMRRIIREVEPVRPSSRISTLQKTIATTVDERKRNSVRRLNASIQSELDWIVMRALEKDRTRRFPTAYALASDISRFLAGEQVESCPPTWKYRLSKLVKKHRVALFIMMLVIGGLLATTIGTGWQALRAMGAETALLQELTNVQRQEQRTREALQKAEAAEAEQLRLRVTAEALAERERASAVKQRELTDKATWARYQADMRFSALKIEQHANSDARDILLPHFNAQASGADQAWEWKHLLGQAANGVRGWKNTKSELRGVAWNHAGNEIASVAYDGVCRVVSAETGQIVRSWQLGRTILCSVAWSPDDQYLAWGSAASENMIRIWNRKTDQVFECRVLPEDKNGSVWAIDWSSDSSRIAVGCLQPIIWAKVEGERLQNVKIYERTADDQWIPIANFASDSNVRCISLNSDVSTYAILSQNASVAFCDAINLELEHRLEVSNVVCGDWIPHKSQYICGLSNGQCLIYDTVLKQEMLRFPAHLGNVEAIATSADGSRFATGGDDGALKVWATKDQRLVFSSQPHSGTITSLAWSPDSRQLVTVGTDGFTFVHSLDPTDQHQEWVWEGVTADFRWTANNSLRLIRNGDEIIDTNARTGEELRTSKIQSRGPIQHLNRDWVYSNVDNLGQIVSIENPSVNYVTDKQMSIAIAPDGSSVAIVAKDLDKVKIFKNTGEWSYLQNTSEIRHISKMEYSNSGQRLAIAGNGTVIDGGFTMYAGWLYTANWKGEPDYRRVRVGDRRIEASAVAWSPDDQWIVAANDEGLCGFYSAQNLTPIWTRNLHRARVSHIAWHPGGHRVASAGKDLKVNLWEPQTGDIVLTLPVEKPVTQLAFSPDGTMLAAALDTGKMVVWDSLAGQSFADSKLTVDLFESYALKDLIRQEKWRDLQAFLNRKHTFPQPLVAVEQLELATINAYMKDNEKYKNTCQSLMENADEITDNVDEYYASWACAIAPEALNDYSVAIELASQVVAKEQEREASKQINLPSFLTCLGALQFRSAQLHMARENLTRVVSFPERDAVRPPYAEYLLALTCHALQDSEAAQRYCKDADRIAEQMLLDTNIQWRRRLAIELFQHEARSAISTLQK